MVKLTIPCGVIPIKYNKFAVLYNVCTATTYMILQAGLKANNSMIDVTLNP